MLQGILEVECHGFFEAPGHGGDTPFAGGEVYTAAEEHVPGQGVGRKGHGCVAGIDLDPFVLGGEVELIEGLAIAFVGVAVAERERSGVAKEVEVDAAAEKPAEGIASPGDTGGGVA